MEQSKARRKTAYAKLLVVALAASFFAMHSCKDDDFSSANKDHNVTLAFTRAGDTSAEQIPTMRLFTFYNDNAAPNDKMFHGEVLNLARNLSASQVSAQVETGTWNMVLLSTPNGGNIMPPVAGTVMSQLPMYKYQPTTSNGKSSNAHEIFLDNQVTPNITSGGSHNMTAQLNRTVAKVELIIEKTTPNFNLDGTHSIKLHNVPSTLSYTGALLPGKATPDTLSGALRAPVQLQNAGNGSYEGVETISFIIPAHRGADYINYTGTTPNDTTTLKMDVTVDLERVGGTRFAKQAEIPVVAKANMVLRVYITVNDGLEFRTEVLDWQGVPLDMTVGAGYQNWLYVKKGATGNGISWSDALPDISTAITKATALMNAGKTVNGVLVAGGSDASMLYSEGFDIPQNVKVYGGWAGTPGTELAGGDAAAVYTSANRDLKSYKARVNTGNGNIVLNGANAILDGFAVSGSGSSSTVGLVAVFNATAWANAIEIDQQASIASTYALSVSTGIGTNILVSRNNKGVSVAGSGKLINATIANNTTASSFSGILLNTVYWGNSGTATTAGTINYCAFQGTVPAGTNYPLNDTNDMWFTAVNIVPGPHFDLGATTGLARYEAGTAKPNRAPMLRRGNKSAFDSNLPITIADQYKKDINGNVRYHTAIDGTTQIVDIGCYESGTLSGFQLQWASDRVYVSAKNGYITEVPLLLPANEDADINIGVTWTATIGGAGTLQYCEMVAAPPVIGTGSGVLVGSFQIKTLPATGTLNTDRDQFNNYIGSSERECGKVNVSTNLGIYLPDATFDVWQTPGSASVWDNGYVGSFHRNNERGARYVSGSNTGNWSVRIISGLDWIKIDANDRDYGSDITSEPNTIRGGYYKEVEEAWGGVIDNKTGNIKFRVGIKSTLASGDAPRYGLIVITRTGGVAYFFVRQGEEPDYLFRNEDPRTVGTGNRNNIKKFSAFNLVAPSTYTMVDGGVDVGATKATWVTHPSKIGDFFQWDRTRAYRRGIQTSALTPDVVSVKTTTPTDACPSNYRLGTVAEWVETVYMNVATPTTSSVSPTGDEQKRNFVWGRYADGYYDQLAPELTLSTTDALGSATGSGVAMKGILMVNHYNYSSIFFPGAGVMPTGSPTTVLNSTYAMYHTATTFNTGVYSGRDGSGIHGTHWSGGSNPHIGMTCTQIHGQTATASSGAASYITTYSHAAPVRCVKE